MFKIEISGIIYEVDEVEVKNQRLFIDGVDQGPIGFTFDAKVIEGQYEFIIEKDRVVRWLSK